MNNKRKRHIRLKKHVLISVICIFLAWLAGIFIWGSGAYKPQDMAKRTMVNNGEVLMLVDENITSTLNNITT